MSFPIRNLIPKAIFLVPSLPSNPLEERQESDQNSFRAVQADPVQFLASLVSVQDKQPELDQKPFKSISQAPIWQTVLEDPDHPSARSALATIGLTKELIAFNPAFLTNRSVKVLYPGSGSHVAVLDIAHYLISQNLIDDAKFIFTEIDPLVIPDLRKILFALRTDGFYENVVESEKVFGQNPPQKDITFEVTYKGKKIEIIFSLNRSGNDYYREEDFIDVDVFYNHDLTLSASENYAMVLKSIGKTKRQKPLFFMGENLFGSTNLAHQGDMVSFGDFIGGRPFMEEQTNFSNPLFFNLLGTSRVVPEGFGHRGLEIAQGGNHDEKGPYRYKSGLLIRFDVDRLQGFSPEGYERLVDYIFLANGAFSKEGFANGKTYGECVVMQPSYFLTVNQFIHSPQFRNQIANTPALWALSVYGLAKFQETFWVLVEPLLQEKGIQTYPFSFYFSQRSGYPGNANSFFPEPSKEDCIEFAKNLSIITKFIFSDDKLPRSFARNFQEMVYFVITLPDPLFEAEQDYLTVIPSNFNLDVDTQRILQIAIEPLLLDGERILKQFLMQRQPIGDQEFSLILSGLRSFERVAYKPNPAFPTFLRSCLTISKFSDEQRIEFQKAIDKVFASYEKFEQINE